MSRRTPTAPGEEQVDYTDLDSDAIYIAIKDDEPRHLEQLLDETRLDVNVIYKNIGTFLAFACKAKSIKVVKYLLEQHSIDVNLPSPGQKFTPLHIATLENSIPIAIALLKKGAHPNAQDIDGNTPVHIIATNAGKNNGANIILTELITYGANVNVKNKAGNTANEILSFYSLSNDNEWTKIQCILVAANSIETKREHGEKLPDIKTVKFKEYLNKYSQSILAGVNAVKQSQASVPSSAPRSAPGTGTGRGTGTGKIDELDALLEDEADEFFRKNGGRSHRKSKTRSKRSHKKNRRRRRSKKQLSKK